MATYVAGSCILHLKISTLISKNTASDENTGYKNNEWA